MDTACCREKKMECVIKDYNVYKGTCTCRWAASIIAKELVCSREATNMADRYTTTVMNEETNLGHSQYQGRFLQYVQCCYEGEVPYGGSSIRCTVMRSRHYSSQKFSL